MTISINDNNLLCLNNRNEIYVQPKKKYTFNGVNFFKNKNNTLKLFQACFLDVNKKLDKKHVKLICKEFGKVFGLNRNLKSLVLQCIFNEKNINTELYCSKAKLCLTDAQLLQLQKIQSYLDPNSQAFQKIKNLSVQLNLMIKLKKINLDTDLAVEYQNDLVFLFESRIIYSIIGYQNTTASGKKDHCLKYGYNSELGHHLLIKKEGNWIPVIEIKKTLNWDAKEKMLVSKNNPHERWNYFYNGLVPIDRFFHHEASNEKNYPNTNRMLHPVAKLSESEMDCLLQQAYLFEEGLLSKNITIQKNRSPYQLTKSVLFPIPERSSQDDNNLLETKKKNCVVQIVSNPRPLFTAKYLKNLNALIPVHCGIRIIKGDGTVYSTGFGSTLIEDVYNTGWNKFLGTINGQPTILDYEEFRAHQGRIVTSVPVSSTEAEEILNKLNSYRSNSIRFNLLKQNCMSLGVEILSRVGVELNIKISVDTLLRRGLPDFYKNFFTKNSNSKLADQTKTQKNINKKTNFLHKIQSLFTNFVVAFLGGRIGSPIDGSRLRDNKGGDLESFFCLVGNIFRENAVEIHHSSILINWQLKQKSTLVHTYSGQPNMNILPSQNLIEINKAEFVKNSFIDLYKYSTSVD